jgi:hypothetical protein
MFKILIKGLETNISISINTNINKVNIIETIMKFPIFIKNHKNNWILSIIFQVTTKFQTENIKQKVGISKIDKKIRS